MLLFGFSYVLFSKELLNEEKNNSTSNTTNEPSLKQDYNELETVNIYKYSNGGYGIENYGDSSESVLYTIKCKNFSKNDNVFIAFDGSKFYFVDLSLANPKLEELVLNNSYNYNFMNIKIDVYSKGDYNGFVINGQNISSDFKENAWGVIEVNGKNYELTFDLKTLEQGYLSISNQKETTIYNINNNDTKFKLDGNYSFYTYDDSYYALKKFAEDHRYMNLKEKEKLFIVYMIKILILLRILKKL